MDQSPAFFYDGKSSKRQKVMVRFDAGGGLHVTGLEKALYVPWSSLVIHPRVGRIPRGITLTGGAKCEVEDNALVDAVVGRMGGGGLEGVVSRLEGRMSIALVSVVLLVLCGWLFLEVGIPFTAKKTAQALPPAFERNLGEESIKVLDRLVFKPTRLKEARQKEFREVFARVADDFKGSAFQFKLLFRHSPQLGPNALALPSGIVVLTDDMARLYAHMEEAEAVFAHELGHVVNRHAVRTILQNSAVVLIISALTGDVASLSFLAVAVPTMFIESKYSRDFEREADQQALDYMRRHKIPLHRFADILKRLESRYGEGKQHNKPGRRGQGADPMNYLSSHPATEERVETIMSAKAPATPQGEGLAAPGEGAPPQDGKDPAGAAGEEGAPPQDGQGPAGAEGAPSQVADP